MKSEKGQSLMEVIVAATVGILVASTLTFATIFSLRNANFAKNSAQATKLAQEGIEMMRSLRDRDTTISTDIVYPLASPARNIDKFSELFSVNLSHEKCNTVSGDAPCYFKLNIDTQKNVILVKGKSDEYEQVGSFQRQVAIGDQISPDTTDAQKIVTVTIIWNDPAGSHESKLSTVLRKL